MAIHEHTEQTIDTQELADLVVTTLLHGIGSKGQQLSDRGWLAGTVSQWSRRAAL
ncbi:hypothetical protein [Saccharopolyspora mangrovi]|uniref:Uncharacterized protein n=1 Tax=Saccharopolyspora mangrovi TaxID=3082379 RepID=A0ABU6AH51_9PSEU|nr:hypothetical protein [Saccharopolyspora sp. S2-29]MEB3370836.1 hypothetical protein [Saccharopolyspora sp. S2-29]